MLTAHETPEPTDPSLWSSHRFDNGSGPRAKLHEIRNGAAAAPLVNAGMVALALEVGAIGGMVYFGENYRSFEDQQKAHSDPTSSAVKAGFSTHQSGHGADLSWLGITADEFAGCAAKTGWTPISTSEAHWECLGPWADLYEVRGPSEAAMAMCLYQGNAYGWYDPDTADGRARTDIRATQALCWHEGFPAGAIDGIDGPTTRAAVAAMEAAAS